MEQRKFSLSEAAVYLAGNESAIPIRRMRQLAKLITHTRISKRTWVFLQSDLDAFLTRHRHEALLLFPAGKSKKAAK